MEDGGDVGKWPKYEVRTGVTGILGLGGGTVETDCWACSLIAAATPVFDKALRRR